ncbi:MAG: helix-turn-helix domain-containing protein [Prevotella sp.]|nr:helix-turn-helix domain-containing protein [Prevotella sp.]
MSSIHQLHRRTYGHRLFMAVVIAVFAVATIASSCKNEGALSTSEQKELDYYRKAIKNAQDSGQLEKLLILCKEFYEVSPKGHSTLFRIEAATDYSQALVLTGQPDEGKRIADEAMSLTSGLDNDSLKGEIYNTYGIYEMIKGQNIYVATEYFLKALGCARQRNDKSFIAGALSNLVSSMTNQRDTTGMRYALESYQLAKDVGDTYSQTFALVNLVVQSQFKKDYKGAAKWLQILQQTAGSSFMAVEIKALQADISRAFNDYEKAHHFINQAIAIADTSRTIQSMERENAYFVKAKIFNQQGRYAESNQWLEKLEALSQQTQISVPKAELASIYAENYEHLGNYQKALEYRNLQIEIKSDNTNSDRIKIQKAKEVALDLAQKDAEIEHHRDHARMMEWSFWGILAFCLLLSGASVYIYNMYRKQRKLMTVVVERAQPETVTIEQKKMDERHVELFRRMKEVIDDKKMFLDANLSRESLAESLGTNRTYISEAVSQMTGMSFPQYISSLRVAEAERQLHDSGVDVSNLTEFGRSLGFTSLSAFQTAFKRQTGMTLSAYREIARK